MNYSEVCTCSLLLLFMTFVLSGTTFFQEPMSPSCVCLWNKGLSRKLFFLFAWLPFLFSMLFMVLITLLDVVATFNFLKFMPSSSYLLHSSSSFLLSISSYNYFLSKLRHSEYIFPLCSFLFHTASCRKSTSLQLAAVLDLSLHFYSVFEHVCLLTCMVYTRGCMFMFCVVTHTCVNA